MPIPGTVLTIAAYPRGHTFDAGSVTHAQGFFIYGAKEVWSSITANGQVRAFERRRAFPGQYIFGGFWHPFWLNTIGTWTHDYMGYDWPGQSYDKATFRVEHWTRSHSIAISREAGMFVASVGFTDISTSIANGFETWEGRPYAFVDGAPVITLEQVETKIAHGDPYAIEPALDRLTPELLETFMINDNEHDGSDKVRQQWRRMLSIAQDRLATARLQDLDLLNNRIAIRNYPNPVTDRTTFEVKLDIAGPITIEVFDATGRRVAIVADEFVHAGRHEYAWSPQSTSGGWLAAGVYIARVMSGQHQATTMIAVMK